MVRTSAVAIAIAVLGCGSRTPEAPARNALPCLATREAQGTCPECPTQQVHHVELAEEDEPGIPEPVRPPPFGQFKVQKWPPLSVDGRPTVSPPAAALRPWRSNVQRDDDESRPVFVEMPADDSSLLAMPVAFPWRCLLSPVEIRGNGPYGAPVPEYWIVTRSVRCSQDQWRTVVEASNHVFAYKDGRVEAPADVLTLRLKDPNGMGATVVVVPPATSMDARARRVYLPP